ncbi:MAG TPA: hypothetical protein VJI46_05425 [Candidatus Nanoarchaeia archaeon]|nr:hypothetical protein [Candidatus Nanoarchaeia archaeon]
MEEPKFEFVNPRGLVERLNESLSPNAGRLSLGDYVMYRPLSWYVDKNQVNTTGFFPLLQWKKIGHLYVESGEASEYGTDGWQHYDYEHIGIRVKGPLKLKSGYEAPPCLIDVLVKNREGEIEVTRKTLRLYGGILPWPSRGTLLLPTAMFLNDELREFYEKH